MKSGGDTIGSRIGLVTLLAALLPAPHALSAELSLDQCSPPRRDVSAFIGNQAQTLTVGKSGYLAAFDVYVSRNVIPNPEESLVWEIRATFGPLPRLDPQAILGAGTVPVLSLPDHAAFFRIEIPGIGIPVQAGERLALALRSTNIVGQWHGGQNDEYFGGMFFSLQTGEPYVFSFVDLTFNTYIRTLSAPVLNPTNNHFYDLVERPAAWPDARNLAAGMSFTNHDGNVFDGRLATIRSQQENDFIRVNLPNIYNCPGHEYWLGGLQPAGSAEPDGNWQWVTGELFTFQNWAPGEPDNLAANDNALSFSSLAPGAWSDRPASDMLSGFIVEYTPADTDGDGVPDQQDACPDTPHGITVDTQGCSIGQLVPCDGPSSGGAWKSHGEYLSALSSAVQVFLDSGLITRQQAQRLVASVAQSGCGRR